MKKYRILLLIIPVGLLIVWILLRMNEVGILYDNTTPAQELVSEVYDSELKDTLVDENGVCRFDTLKELAEHFKVECVRAPQEYRQSYKPYAVLLFDDGSRAFVFFDPDSFEIAKCLILDEVVGHDAMAKTLDELQKSNATFDEWRALEKYNTGTSTSKNLITVPMGISLEEAKRHLHEHRIENARTLHNGERRRACGRARQRQ